MYSFKWNYKYYKFYNLKTFITHMIYIYPCYSSSHWNHILIEVSLYFLFVWNLILDCHLTGLRFGDFHLRLYYPSGIHTSYIESIDKNRTSWQTECTKLFPKWPLSTHPHWLRRCKVKCWRRKPKSMFGV